MLYNENAYNIPVVKRRRKIMKETLEKLWDEYFACECAVINTEKEKALIKKAVGAQKAIDELLTKEQSEAPRP